MGTIDGTLNGIAMGIVPWFTRLAGRVAVGVSLPLRLRHGAGAGHPDALARHRGGRAMNSLLSLVTFLPLIGAVVLMVFLRGDDALAQKNAKLLALFTTTATFLVSLFVLFGFDAVEPGLPVRRGAGLDRRAHLQDGGRRHLGPVRDADDLPDAADDRGELGGDGAGQGVHGRVPAARDADARRLRGARPRALLHLLRGRPHPDVPDHRHLGRQGPRLRQLQVLPLHLLRLGADARRDDRDVLAGGHHRHPDAARASPSRRSRCGSWASP